MNLCRLCFGLLLAASLPGMAVAVHAEDQLPALKSGEHIELIYHPSYLAQHGWKMPRPPYPEKARMLRETGRVYLHLATDKTGRVVKTSILPTPLNTRSKTLRQLIVLWTLYKWSGPPNTSTNIGFDFVLR